ncbi:hypothetical protein V6O07_14590, partial [Arthrospira platensis SPKY2]
KFKLDIGKNIDNRFSALTSKQQGDSEVIEAREGKIDLLTNLKTFLRRTEHDSDISDINSRIDSSISDINDVLSNHKKSIDNNTSYINSNDEKIKDAIDFVSSLITNNSLQ